MSASNLSSEIVSLIHHVELNKAGWRNKAIGQVAVGVLWKSDSYLNINELIDKIYAATGVSEGERSLRKQIEILKSEGKIVELDSGRFKVTEQEGMKLTEAEKKSEEEAAACKQDFLKKCKIQCPRLDPKRVWDEFNLSLVSLIRSTGANFFKLITGGNIEHEDNWFLDFIEKYPEEDREGLREVLVHFFDQKKRTAVISY